MLLGLILTGIGLLGVVAATIYYIRDTRPGNHDVMGTARMFDDVMLPSLLVLSIGIVLTTGWRWWLAILLFAALYFVIGMGYKFALIHLVARLHDRKQT